MRRAAQAGASGLIVPDLPHDESAELRAACDAEGIALVALVAPTTTPERLRAIGADARGFVYVVSLAGTTGERGQLDPRLPALVERTRAVTDLPVAVGFGISTGDQAGSGRRPGRRSDRGQPDRARGRRGRRRRGRPGGGRTGPGPPIGCAAHGRVRDQSPRSRGARDGHEAIEKMAESYFEAVADRDPDAMASHWHAQGVDDMVPLGPLRGPGAVRSFFVRAVHRAARQPSSA